MHRTTNATPLRRSKMTREEAIKATMKEKDTALLRILASHSGFGAKDVKEGAKKELEARGEKL
jgi:hypothetical protein